MSFTIIGGSGFIGSALVSKLCADGHNVFVPERDDHRLFQRDLGHVIYAAGVTADFRTRPFDTMRAHVGLLALLLEHASFKSFLYLSSARIYRHAAETHEGAPISVQSELLEDYYDLTKLAGEALCHASGRENVRVARLSNVIGRDFQSKNFIFDLIRSASEYGRIKLRSALDSEKDYVIIEDVAAVLPLIAMSGKQRCYNIATGSNTTHAQIVNAITTQTGASCTVVQGAPRIACPPIDIRRLQSEFRFEPQDFLSRIPPLVTEFWNTANAENRS